MGSFTSKTRRILNKYNGEETTNEFLNNISVSDAEYLMKPPIKKGYEFTFDNHVFKVIEIKENEVYCEYKYTIRNNSFNYELSKITYAKNERYITYIGTKYLFKYHLGDIGESDYFRYMNIIDMYKRFEITRECEYINKNSKHELKSRYIGKDYYDGAPPKYKKVANN